MSTRASRRNKAQLASQATVPLTDNPSEDAASTAESNSSNTDALMVKAHVENNEQGTSSAEVTQTAGSSRGKKSTGSQRTSSKRTTKQKKMEAAEKEDDGGKDTEGPAAKKSKKTKEAVAASTDTVTSKKFTSNSAKSGSAAGGSSSSQRDEQPMETDDNVDAQKIEQNNDTYPPANTDVRPPGMNEKTLPTMPVPTVGTSSEERVIREHIPHQNVSNAWNSGTRSNFHGRTELHQRQTPQVHQEMVDGRENLTLHAYGHHHVQPPSAVQHILPESHKPAGSRVASLRKYLVAAFLILAAGILIAVLISKFGVPDYTQWTDYIESKVADLHTEIRGDTTTESKEFLLKMKELQGKFPSQTPRLWRILESATLPIIEEDSPAHPAVILLVAAHGNGAVAECLARRYAETLTQSFGARARHVMFDCETQTNRDTEDAKREIDTTLSDAFDAGSKAALVLHLDQLPGQAAMIFYRFADNDNAPYKKVALALTLTLESSDTGSEKDNVAYEELRRLWKSSFDVDKVEPLLSRIGNSVAFVRPETDDTLANNC